MGRFQRGILGGFSGKIGTVVGGNINGVDFMRSLPLIRKKTRDTKQDIQRLKFSLVTKFLRMMRPLLNVSFKLAATSSSGYNNAFSYNVQKAITGTYPDFELNYSAAMIAQGSLLAAELAAVVSNDPGKIRFTWIDNSGFGSGDGSDKAILVTYHPETQSARFITSNAVLSPVTQYITCSVNVLSERTSAGWMWTIFPAPIPTMLKSCRHYLHRSDCASLLWW